MSYHVSMYISRIPNRSSPPAILLRESYREKGKVKTRTLANLSKLPAEAISLLKGNSQGFGKADADKAASLKFPPESAQFPS